MKTSVELRTVNQGTMVYIPTDSIHYIGESSKDVPDGFVLDYIVVKVSVPVWHFPGAPSLSFELAALVEQALRNDGYAGCRAHGAEEDK